MRNFCKIALSVFLALATPRAIAATIVLDPGHGGHDPGGIPGQRVVEKHAALDVALRLRSRLQSLGHNVIMTRSTDVFVELSRRVEISNRTPGKPLFISIHFNSAPNSDARGIETYFYDRRGLALAKSIHGRVVRASGEPDRGIRRARFYVLRYNRKPSVLLELGFLTNPREAAKVAKSAEYRQRLAFAVADGVCATLR